MGKCQISNSRKSRDYGRGKNINLIRITTIKWIQLNHIRLKLHSVETNLITTVRSARNEK